MHKSRLKKSQFIHKSRLKKLCLFGYYAENLYICKDIKQMADFLSKDGKKLYYYRKDSWLEVDSVMRIDGECVIIECKAATGNTKSAKTILRHPEKY